VPSSSDTTVTIYCTEQLPKKRLIDWQVVTTESSRVAVIHSSGNAANVSIDLKSSGDIETHKLLALVIRYCLRYGRYLMDANGLQVSTSNQNYPAMFDEDQSIFQTVFTLQGKIWDNWIQTEKNNPQGISLEVIPVQTNSVQW
jgi:hypothetical protein